MALLRALVYTLIHIAEGEVITPMLLAKRFSLNFNRRWIGALTQLR